MVILGVGAVLVDARKDPLCLLGAQKLVLVREVLDKDEGACTRNNGCQAQEDLTQCQPCETCARERMLTKIHCQPPRSAMPAISEIPPAMAEEKPEIIIDRT